MRLTIITALWMRHDLSNIVLSYYNRIRNNIEGYEITLLAVGSEGELSKQIAENNGWQYIEYPNDILTFKFNALFQAAEKTNPDLVMLIGSDDLLSPEIITGLCSLSNRNAMDIVGLADLYWYSTERDTTLYFGGYGAPSPKTIGAGRVFSFAMLDKIFWKPWKSEQLNSGLDTCCSRLMAKYGIGEKEHWLKDLGGCAVDIKHTDSISKWGTIFKYSRIVPNDEVERFFPDEFAALRAMPHPNKNLIP